MTIEQQPPEYVNDNHNNQLEAEFLGIHALNFSCNHNSPSRGVMFASHFSQRLVIDGATERRIQTGMDHQFAPYTLGVRMPENGEIIRTIDRYPAGVGYGSLTLNPETLVIYEVDQDRTIDCFSITDYASYHQFFGYRYNKKEAISKLYPKSRIEKGTVFADTPSASDNNGFMPGIELNVAFMSIPSVSEDGIMISRDVLEKLKFRVYESRVLEFGANNFALNLYGSRDNYKSFPDLGEYIKEDGLLMILRSYDPEVSPVEMSAQNTQEPDFMFDSPRYVRGGRGKVVDIKVYSNNNPNKNLPTAMTEQLEKYRLALVNYYQEIIQTIEKLSYDHKRKYGHSNLRLSPNMHRLMVEALAVTNYNPLKLKQPLGLHYRTNPLDEYRVEFVIEYEMIPDKAYKLTGQQGD